jgi:hypothetical protein
MHQQEAHARRHSTVKDNTAHSAHGGMIPQNYTLRTTAIPTQEEDTAHHSNRRKLVQGHTALCSTSARSSVGGFGHQCMWIGYTCRTCMWLWTAPRTDDPRSVEVLRSCILCENVGYPCDDEMVRFPVTRFWCVMYLDKFELNLSIKRTDESDNMFRRIGSNIFFES